MKLLIIFLLCIQPVFAGTIYCRSNEHDLHLHLDVTARTFSFAQHCWSPCHMGEGQILAGPLMGWAGIRYQLELTNSQYLIEPMTTKKYTLLMDFDYLSGNLSDKTGNIQLVCERDEE